MKIVLTGPKGSGKSLIGKLLSQNFSLPFIETDEVIEQLFAEEMGENLSCRGICSEFGEELFRDYERRAIKRVASSDYCIISTGGSSFLTRRSRELLRKGSVLVLLYASSSLLLERVYKNIPPFLDDKHSRELFVLRANLVIETLRPIADILIDSSGLDVNKVLSTLIYDLRGSLAEGYLKNIGSSLLFLGQMDSSRFLLSLNKKNLKKLGAGGEELSYVKLPGITIRKEELSLPSRVEIFSIHVAEETTNSLVSVIKRCVTEKARNEQDFLAALLSGIVASAIIRAEAIRVDTRLFPKDKEQDRNIQKVSIEIELGAFRDKKVKELFSALSMFFLFCMEIAFEPKIMEQQLKDNESIVSHSFLEESGVDVLSFYLNSPSKEEEKVLVEVINSYCALIIFNTLF